MDIIDDDLNSQSKMPSVISTLIIGLFSYLTVVSYKYIIASIIKDIAIISGVNYTIGFITISLVTITFVIVSVNYGFQVIPEYLKKGSEQTVIKWLIIAYFIAQVIQFFCGLYFYEIAPAAYLDNATEYLESKPLGSAFLFLETLISYSALIIIYIIYRKRLKFE